MQTLEHHSFLASLFRDPSFFDVIHAEEQASPSKTLENFIGQGVDIVKCFTSSSASSLSFSNSVTSSGSSKGLAGFSPLAEVTSLTLHLY